MEYSPFQSWGKLLTRGAGNCPATVDCLATAGSELRTKTNRCLAVGATAADGISWAMDLASLSPLAENGNGHSRFCA